MRTVVRPVAESDARAICAVYNHYVAHTVVTFETDPVSDAEMAGRIRDVTAGYPWLVAERDDGTVVGYAYASRWRTRVAYDRTVESTIYLQHTALRAGVGTPLYRALLAELRARDVHAVVGCIALPNPGSVAFHERFGFVPVGRFPEVGRKFDRWVDVGFWQVTW